MLQGNISVAGNSFVLVNSNAVSLAYTSGTIVGPFERYISQTMQSYLFPVGSAVRTQPFIVSFAEMTPGSLLVDFSEGDPGNDGLPLTDGGSYTITNQYTTGYWVALSRNSFASSNYTLDLDATGFGPYPLTDGTRVIRRNGTDDWTLDGTHSGVAGSVISRSGMTQSFSSAIGGSQFCIGKTGPFIIAQPADKTICPGSSDPELFQVTAVGFLPLSYQWYKDSGEILTNDGHFAGVTSSTLSITNVSIDDSGEYYCVVTTCASGYLRIQ
jgi:hypothetical protein